MSVQTCLAELLRATGEGRTQDEASGNGCRQAFAQLLLADPSRVVLQVIRYFQRQNQNENHLRPAPIISTCIGTNAIAIAIVVLSPVAIVVKPSVRESTTLQPVF